MDMRLCLIEAIKIAEKNENQDNSHWVRDIITNVDHALTHFDELEKAMDKVFKG